MHQVPFLVSECRLNSISALIKECFGAKFPDISKKKQIVYLLNYLDKLNAKSVVCETNYIDRDFLIDHQTYYTRSFHNYPSRTARLHFFSKEFKHCDLESWILKNNEEEIDSLKSSYLGFSIIKPLPLTFIGRTALKKYAQTQHCISRTYNVSLFGIDLEVDSIAFQEQDKAVSACATTSLWTLLHATQHFNVNDIDSPSTITLKAIAGSTAEINGFPNKGLRDFELLKALEAYGLKQHEFKVNETSSSFSYTDAFDAIRCFLRSGIPVLAATRVFDDSQNSETYSLKGEHALCILGFKDNCNGDLESIYLHDDRVGSYVKADVIIDNTKKFVCKNNQPIENPGAHFSIKVFGQEDSWNEVFTIDSVKVATYHKIRVWYGLIIHASNTIQNIINKAIEQITNLESSLKNELYLDFNVKLVKSSEIKSEYLANTKQLENRREILLASFPKYVWVSRFFYRNTDGSETEAVFDMIFDPTDSPAGNPLVANAILSDNFERYFGIISDYFNATTLIRNTENIEESYSLAAIRSLIDKNKDFFQRISDLYGKLSAPVYIKDDEVNRSTKSDIYDPELSGHNRKDLNQLYENLLIGEKQYPIWAITKYGNILIGSDSGHPTLTEASPARISGDIRKVSYSEFAITPKSGRYSSNYTLEEQEKYLENVRLKFKCLFPNINFSIAPTE